MSRIHSVVLAILLVAFALGGKAQTPDACSGDCDNNAVVTIDEIVRLVTAVLGGDVAECRAGDVDGDNAITIEEVITAVGNALNGCTLLPSRSEAIDLFPGLKLEVGEQPVSLAVADVDGDGQLDLCTANEGSNDLSLLRRTQGGGFKRYMRIATGGEPRVILATKLGAAQRDVILAANRLDDELSVTVVRSDSVVTEKFRVGSSPIALAAADLDGDSVSDVVVANRDSGDVSVLLANADGSLALSRAFAAGGNPSSVGIGDFDGNSTADIVAAIGAQQLAVLSGLGDGQFDAPRLVDAGMPAAGVMVDDVDGDFIEDLVIVGEFDELASSARISVLLGHGDGTFQAGKDDVVESRFEGVVLADVDDDRAPDLISAGDSNVAVRFGRGDGSFLNNLALPSGCPVSAVSVADLNGDGANDIVYACGFDDDVAVLWGLHDREFTAEQILPVGGMLPDRILTADANGDGVIDLATVNRLSDDVSIVLAAGHGEFAAPTVVATQPGLLGAAFGDLDGDAAADLVSSHESPACRDCLVVFSSNSDGSFERRQQLSVAPRVVGLAIADVDKDGLGDIISLGAGGVSLFIGLDGFAFEAERRFAAGIDPRSMSVSDLNADSVSDVAAANAGSLDVSVLLSTGNGDFSPAVTLPLTLDPAGIKAVDINVDGDTDLVVAGGGQVSVFLGEGNGRFSAERRLAVALQGGPIAFGDVNRDGLPDLVAIGDGSSVYLGTGASLFHPALRFAGNPLAVDLILFDANADGALDIVTANATLPGTVSVIRGIAP